MVYYKEYARNIRIAFIVLIIFTSLSYCAHAVPVGPTITEIRNETGSAKESTLINTTGGSITTMELNVTAQNLKWKAFVGNVTGNLVLSDASNYSIYDWSLSRIVGEVYATRSSSTVSWSDIKCSNLTHITNEEIALNHTSNPDDNISATFNVKNHNPFYIGTVEITSNSCYSIHTNVNNQSQNSSFEEIILYDGTDYQNGDIVYATNLEQDAAGYNNNQFDFQMIIPEVALPAWDSSTAYYFYVELT
ncbi:hypothetical protein COY26_04315 [Candidatus Woesearchaeota archaeon CG_4_10_14_0_2_um_filter_33_10]|nr:MAG: hypothetical protein AUJ83_04090 [Candidatus Woesearchaeota archaeon CG1_02_33_12]PIZ52568.1 MAG: hypothetical protein COY26_04315 [Candidatus Woesearchaeota archaeon CG_4_10_14_0_2_um_filter_33_10]